MQLRAVGRRCSTGAATVLGDIAQGTTPWATPSWEASLTHLGKAGSTVTVLDRGFRVPRTVIEFAGRLLPVIAPGTAVEGGLVDPEAGLPPDVEVPNHLGRRLVFDLGTILMPAPLAAAASGKRPSDLEAVSVLMAVIPGDLHAGGQVHLDRHAGHGACPVGDPDVVPRDLLGIRP